LKIPDKFENIFCGCELSERYISWSNGVLDYWSSEVKDILAMIVACLIEEG